MRRVILTVGAVVSLGVAAAVVWSRDAGRAEAVPAPARVAAAGRVEPVSEERVVAAEATGRLARVLVDEGDRVARGQVLAIIANDDRAARVAAAEARLARLLNGARPEERRQARAALSEAQAVADHARSRLERVRAVARSSVGHDEADRAEREHEVALARLEAARAALALVEAESRAEDIAAARAARDEAKALLEKTIVRAPVAGVVTRRHRNEGESVVETAPVVTVADDSVRRVRAEIDETDVGRVAVGQRVHVTADAFGSRRFAGRIVRVGLSLGRKQVITDEPTERRDTKVLEALVELEDGRELPLNLRVDVYVEVDERPPEAVPEALEASKGGSS